MDKFLLSKHSTTWKLDKHTHFRRVQIWGSWGRIKELGPAKSKSILDCFRSSSQEKWPSNSAWQWWDISGLLCSAPGSWGQKKMWIYWRRSSTRSQRRWSIFRMRDGWESWVCSSWRREGSGESLQQPLELELLKWLRVHPWHCPSRVLLMPTHFPSLPGLAWVNGTEQGWLHAAESTRTGCLNHRVFGRPKESWAPWP